MTKSPAASSRGTRVVRWTTLLTASLSFAGLLGAAPASAATGTVSGSADDQASANGSVKAITRIGNRIYIGGSFTTVGGLPRRGLAALNAETGAVDPAWSADVSGEVLALAPSPYGTTVYVGGTFTSVRGYGRANLAAVSATTGVVSSWNPGANASVLAVTSSPGAVIVGGKFTRIAGAYVRRLAMLSSTDGHASSRFLPQPDNWVASLRLSPSGSGLYVGGNFSRIGGQYRPHLAAVYLSSGAASGWYPDAYYCPALSLALSPNATRLYVACGGLSNWVASYNTMANGPRVWRAATDGNVQAITLLGSTLYAGGHFALVNGVERHKVAAFDYATGAMTGWAPVLDSPLGVWALYGTTEGVWAGGDFTTVNRSAKPHVARFRSVS